MKTHATNNAVVVDDNDDDNEFNIFSSHFLTSLSPTSLCHQQPIFKTSASSTRETTTTTQTSTESCNK